MAVATKVPPAPVSSPDQVLADNFGWMLAQASHALGVEMTARLEAVGIAPRGYCLMKTAMSGELTQTEIAHAVAVDKTTMVVTTDALETAGLVERRPSKTDRRAHVITVTKAGKRKVAEAEAIVEQLHDEVLSELSAAERETLLGALGTLIGGALSAPSPCSNPPRRRTPRS
jgi:MarR family transcriptional regulator, transcriptional regulator for hemolysin